MSDMPMGPMPGEWCLVPGGCSLVNGAWPMLPGAYCQCCLVSAECMAPGEWWCLVNGAWRLVNAAWCIVPGECRLVAGDWCLGEWFLGTPLAQSHCFSSLSPTHLPPPC